jgi:hypothetical protein
MDFSKLTHGKYGNFKSFSKSISKAFQHAAGQKRNQRIAQAGTEHPRLCLKYNINDPNSELPLRSIKNPFPNQKQGVSIIEYRRRMQQCDKSHISAGRH